MIGHDHSSELLHTFEPDVTPSPDIYLFTDDFGTHKTATITKWDEPYSSFEVNTMIAPAS